MYGPVGRSLSILDMRYIDRGEGGRMGTNPYIHISALSLSGRPYLDIDMGPIESSR